MKSVFLALALAVVVTGLSVSRREEEKKEEMFHLETKQSPGTRQSSLWNNSVLKACFTYLYVTFCRK